jgi:hypothetical protein
MRTVLTPIALIALVLAIGCGTDDAGPELDADAAVEPATYTWHQDVAPIVHGSCVTCHVAGGIAPFALDDYEDAQPVAGLMSFMVDGGEMPPWGAESSDDCAPRHNWVKDPRLTEEQKEILRVWADEGAPEGDPDTAVPLPNAEPRELSGVTHTIAMPQPYTVPAGYNDKLVCTVIDPGLTSARWLTGLEVTPGNDKVVHHVVLTVVPAAQRAELEGRMGPDGTFECFGGIGVEGLYPLGVWVPGGDPFETPDGIGVPMAAGSAILMQMHYHPSIEADESDRTTAQLRLTPTFPGKNFTFAGVGNAPSAPILQSGPNDRGVAEFRIPANVSGHTETMIFDIDNEQTQRFPMFAVFPHMHYVGVELEVHIERATPNPGEPAEECLVNVERWDFDWQRTYLYDADLEDLPTIGNGDTITIRCSYDNTLANPFVKRALQEQGLTDPVDVLLGEETLDEMCLAAFGVIF